MKTLLKLKLGIFVIGMLALTSTLTQAQTTAPGPYYATPSWDQTLPSSTRFIVLSNFNSEAVLDRETGLVWEKAPSSDFLVWSALGGAGADTHCNSLSIANRKGWRLPTIQELNSLIDLSVPFPGPRLPSGHPFIGVVADYWSATSFAADTSLAWLLDVRDGSSTLANKSASIHVWCVRGGQVVDPQ